MNQALFNDVQRNLCWRKALMDFSFKAVYGFISTVLKKECRTSELDKMALFQFFSYKVCYHGQVIVNLSEPCFLISRTISFYKRLL